jgi:hypothetical protein
MEPSSIRCSTSFGAAFFGILYRRVAWSKWLGVKHSIFSRGMQVAEQSDLTKGGCRHREKCPDSSSYGPSFACLPGNESTSRREGGFVRRRKDEQTDKKRSSQIVPPPRREERAGISPCRGDRIFAIRMVWELHVFPCLCVLFVCDSDSGDGDRPITDRARIVARAAQDVRCSGLLQGLASNPFPKESSPKLV